MKRNYFRAFVAFLVAIMCLCVCVFNVYAVPGEDGEVTPDPGGGDQSSAQSSDVPYIPDPPSGGGDQSSAQSSDVPYIPESNNESSYDGGGGYEGGGGGGDNQTSYESDESSQSSNNVYYDSDGNSYSNQNEVYVGGGQSYQPPASTAPTAELYNTDKKVDVNNELSKNDWNSLSDLLKNTGAADSDGDDFAFIQNNTSKKDNGNWIIIAGLICILLSITGFIYLIASKISRRKKIREGNISKTSDPQKRGVARRSNDDYNDGYGSNRKPEQQKKQQPDRRAEKAKTVSRYSDDQAKTHYSSGKTTKGGKGGKHGRRYR